MIEYRAVRVAACLVVVLLSSCSPVLIGVPTVSDERLERYVTAMGLEIVAVSEHRARWARYEFKLADFRRRDILGLSTGNQKIFISYELSRLAYRNPKDQWLLRHTLAHEIAHDVLGGDVEGSDGAVEHARGLANRITGRDLGLSERIRFRSYSRAAELAADRKGMEYWQKLGWHCHHWVRLFLDFIAQGYAGDLDHPTQERLEQATRICSEQPA